MIELKPHISQWKKDEVKEIVRLFGEYPVAGVIDLTYLPAFQFMKIRKQLKNQMVTKVTKKRLIFKALEQLKDKKNIDALKQYLGGMPSLIFTKEDPFILQKQINKSKSNVAAKPGQIAPDDIRVEAGPTPFTPGPVIGELGRLGLKTEVKEGKIHLKEGKVLVKAGDVIKPEVADLLTKLAIEPMTIGLNLVAAYENKTGQILDKSILSVDEKEYINNLKQAASWAVNLAAFIEYPDAEILKMIIKKAYLSGKSVAKKAVGYEIKEEAELQEKKAEAKVEKPVEAKQVPKVEEKPIVHEKKAETKPVVHEKKTEIKQPEVKEAPNVEEKKAEVKLEEKKTEIKEYKQKVHDQPIVQKSATEVKVEMKQEIKPEDVKVAQAVLRKLQDAKMNKIPRATDLAVKRKVVRSNNKNVTDIINELKDKKSRGEI